MPSIRLATVLVLEESAAVRELIDQALNESGHRVLSTNDALEAVDLLRRVHVDVLVAGFSDKRTEVLLDELRSIQSGLQVVSICGADADDGASLSSPISLDELTEVVAAKIEREDR